MFETYTISRDETIYESFPDVALTDAGRLVCAFTESTHHGDRTYSRNVFVTSDDRGRNWSPKQELTPPLYAHDETEPHWDCPRVSTLADGRVIALVNRTTNDTPNRSEESVSLATTVDGGETWSAFEETPIEGVVPDQVVELEHGPHEGRWYVAAHTIDEEGTWHVRGYYTDDEGASWSEPVSIALDEDLLLCEPSVLELPSGELVCFLRENSGTGYDVVKTISEDGGETWGELTTMPIPGCHRPVAGLLDDGQVMISYRFSQGGAGWLGNWTQNTFLALTDVESCLAASREDAWTRLVPLEYDRSSMADTGYTGWVQFEEGECYVVNYLVDDAPARPVREPAEYDGEYDDAPKAFVRGYAFDPGDLVTR